MSPFNLQPFCMLWKEKLSKILMVSLRFIFCHTEHNSMKYVNMLIPNFFTHFKLQRPPDNHFIVGVHQDAARWLLLTRCEVNSVRKHAFLWGSWGNKPHQHFSFSTRIKFLGFLKKQLENTPEISIRPCIFFLHVYSSVSQNSMSLHSWLWNLGCRMPGLSRLLDTCT